METLLADATSDAWIPVWMAGIAMVASFIAVLGNLVTGVLQYLTKKSVDRGNEAAAFAASEAAEKREVVRTTLENATIKQDEKLENVVSKVEEVRHATNSLTDRLVASTEREALARGGVEERARADANAALNRTDHQL